MLLLFFYSIYIVFIIFLLLLLLMLLLFGPLYVSPMAIFIIKHCVHFECCCCHFLFAFYCRCFLFSICHKYSSNEFIHIWQTNWKNKCNNRNRKMVKTWFRGHSQWTKILHKTFQFLVSMPLHKRRMRHRFTVIFRYMTNVSFLLLLLLLFSLFQSLYLVVVLTT